MIAMLFRAFSAICIGTVLTQVILMGYFVWRGTFNAESGTKMIAMLNGIDIQGDQLVRLLNRSDSNEQPDFEEILEARTVSSLDIDLKLRSQRAFDDELTKKLVELRERETRFDQRRGAFDRKLEEVEKGAREEGMTEVIRTLQVLAADQAKDQLMKIYDDQEIDDVVNIIQGIPMNTRKDILAEFTTPEETEKLHLILKRIGEGMPTTQYIDEARNDR